MSQDRISTDYLNQKLLYTDDGRLVDNQGNAVMMDWEAPIMEKSAEIICGTKSKILNVGFGMGIIDSEIEKYDIEEHWIIEAHPDVYKKMFDDGWHLKSHVKILLGDWRWYLPYLPKFDGIYIDTWDEPLTGFHQYVHNILNENGVYSFFNNPRDDEDGRHLTSEEFEILDKHFDIEFEKIQLQNIDPIKKQTTNGQYYWHPSWKDYYCPKLRFK